MLINPAALMPMLTFPDFFDMLRLEATLRKERGSMDKPFVYVTRKLPEEQLSALKEEARIETARLVRIAEKTMRFH